MAKTLLVLSALVQNTAVSKMAGEGMEMSRDPVTWYTLAGLLLYFTEFTLLPFLAIGFYDTFRLVVANAKAFPNLKWKGLLHYKNQYSAFPKLSAFLKLSD